MATLQDLRPGRRAQLAEIEARRAGEAIGRKDAEIFRQQSIVGDIGKTLNNNQLPLQERIKQGLSLLSQVSPQASQNALAKLAELDPQLTKDLTKAKAEGSLPSELDKIKETGRQSRLTQAAKPKKPGKPLPPKLQEAINTSEQSIEGVKTLQDTLQILIGEGQVGPISGRVESIKNFLGVAEPDSTEFQNFRQFLALGFAAEQNKGRPSEKDFEAADKLLGSLEKQPASALTQLSQVIGNVKANRARLFINAIEAGESEERIQALARAQGLDLGKERLIRAGARELKVPETKFRRNLELLRAFDENPELEVFKDKTIQKNMTETLNQLIQLGLEDLL